MKFAFWILFRTSPDFIYNFLLGINCPGMSLENRNDFIISAFTTLWGPRCPLSSFLLLRGKSEKKLKYIRKGDSGKPRKERERNERKERKRECPRLQASQECANNTRYNWRKAYTMGRRERSSQPSPIASAASTLLSSNKTQIPARRSKTRRRGCGSSWHWLATQDLCIGTLQAARNCCVPTLDLSGWLKAQSCSSAVCKFFDKTDRFFGPKTVPLKRQGAKIKRVHPTVCYCVKDRMITIFVACFVLCNFASCSLTARVCRRVG